MNVTPEGIGAWFAALFSAIAGGMWLRKKNSSDAAARTADEVGSGALITIRQERDRADERADKWRARAEAAEALRVEDARTITQLTSRVAYVEAELTHQRREVLRLWAYIVKIDPDMAAFAPSRPGTL